MRNFTKSAVPGFERDDIELVKLFLSQYKDLDGNSYHLQLRPDTLERNRKAIEAVAVNKHGDFLAIEHTMVEAFTGKKDDDVRFLTAFERLRLDKSLLVPNRFIDIQCPALAIPKGKGIDWKDVGQKVYEWFKHTRKSFPDEGQTWHSIPGVGFDLRVLVETMDLPGTDGVVLVSRILPATRPFSEVLCRALAAKVPKLVGTPANTHILLLEDEGAAIGFFKVIQGIESSAEALPELKDVDEVWIAHTMSWKTKGDVFFYQVWPGGVTRRFHVRDARFSKQQSTSKAWVFVALAGLLVLGIGCVLNECRHGPGNS